ncbi:MAG TPA: substrate-binding domain-containing protein [Vicinamibacteria bacterium]|nr:substrate-binding domain-containing protein [Vicinamibacteria bacterium]
MSITVGVLPKSTRSQYFEECRAGAEDAARELGFVLRWEGPAQSSAAAQAEVVKGWMRDGIPAIAASVENAAMLSPLLRQARGRGMRVLTWDADATADARDFTLVAATPEAIAQALSFTVGRVLGGGGEFAVVTSSLTAPNQAAWLAQLRARVTADYPGVRLADVRECHDVEEQARQQTAALLAAHPGVRLVVGLCAPAVPGAAAAAGGRGEGRVRVTGVSLPSSCRAGIESGLIDSVVIWSTRKLGFFAAAAAHALATGALAPGASTFKGGSQGSVVVRQDEIRLGRVHVVSAGNLAQFLG